MNAAEIAFAMLLCGCRYAASNPHHDGGFPVYFKHKYSAQRWAARHGKASTVYGPTGQVMPPTVRL